MEHLELVAFRVVGRAIGFTGLAIFCLMIALSWNPVIAARAGGYLTLLTAIVLILKAIHVRRQNYRRTEMWLCLPKKHRPPETIAQRTISAVMRDVYLWFAQFVTIFSIGFWVAANVLPFLLPRS